MSVNEHEMQIINNAFERKNIKYTSDNGYTGILYGERSLVILKPDGTESMHTGSRNINSYEDLKRVVDNHPKFIKMLMSIDKEEEDGDADV